MGSKVYRWMTLARELGVSKKTLYQFVENKADLIEQIFVEHLEMEKMLLSTYKDQSSNAIEEILKIARHMIKELRTFSVTVIYDLQKYYRSTWRLLQTVHEQYFFNIIKDNLERGIKEGFYRQDMTPDIIAKLYISKNSSVADPDCFPIKDYPMEVLFIEHMNYHLNGIVSQEGREAMAASLAAWADETN